MAYKTKTRARQPRVRAEFTVADVQQRVPTHGIFHIFPFQGGQKSGLRLVPPFQGGNFQESYLGSGMNLDDLQREMRRRGTEDSDKKRKGERVALFAWALSPRVLRVSVDYCRLTEPD